MRSFLGCHGGWAGRVLGRMSWPLWGIVGETFISLVEREVFCYGKCICFDKSALLAKSTFTQKCTFCMTRSFGQREEVGLALGPGVSDEYSGRKWVGEDQVLTV